jgi:hypothetical protein
VVKVCSGDPSTNNTYKTGLECVEKCLLKMGEKLPDDGNVTSVLNGDLNGDPNGEEPDSEN